MFVITVLLLFLNVVVLTSAALVSDEYAMNVLMHNQREISHARRLQGPGPPGGGPPGGGGGGGGQLPPGASTSTLCGNSVCNRDATSVSGNFIAYATK